LANIVCIKGISAVCEEWDKVSIHDDDVELTGPGYENANIIHVAGKTAAEVNAILNTKIPETKTAQKLPVAGKWSFLEEKPVWKNSEDKWCDLIKQPKYAITFKDLTATDITNLADKEVPILVKEGLIAKATEKIHLDVKNNVEVEDLNNWMVTLTEIEAEAI